MRPRTLSAREARVVLSAEADGVVELDLRGIAARARVRRGYARKLAHSLARKGWLQRLGGGRYLLRPSREGVTAAPETDPFAFGSRMVHPYYFGFATAAELHHLLPQAGRVYYVVSPRRSGPREFAGAEFRPVRVAPSQFFGTMRMVRRGTALSVSDPERTLVDCLDRPDLSGGMGGVVRILESAGPSIDWTRLERYLRRRSNRGLARRFGFLAERLGPRLRPPAGWVRRALPRARDPYAPLGPPKLFGRRGRHDPRWRIVQNVPERVLLAEVDLR